MYVPMVHNQTDMGSMGNELSKEGEKTYGVAIWQDHLVQVNKSWLKIESEVFKRVNLVPAGKIKIYQDGLPVVDETGIKIVKDTAEKGSINYKIIAELLLRGAKLELAENKEYLFQEYYLLSDITKAESPEKALVAYHIYMDLAGDLLLNRDRFIAGQINETLNEGDTGLAFFGASHHILSNLDSDIEVDMIQMFTDPISLKLMQVSS